MSKKLPLPATGTDDLLAHEADGVLVITLNRPSLKNALTRSLLQGLAVMLEHAEASDTVAVVLLRAEGDAFCAGGDVTAMSRGESIFGDAADPAGRIELQQSLQRATVVRLYELSKPTVAVVPGATVGAGLGLALACDLRYWGESSRLMTGFIRLGLAGDFGSTWLLRELVGAARARELLVLSDWVHAGRALELGLANAVVADADLDEHAFRLAKRLAGESPSALREIKENISRAGRLDLGDCADVEAETHVMLTQTDEHSRAVARFMSRSAPAAEQSPAEVTKGEKEGVDE